VGTRGSPANFHPGRSNLLSRITETVILLVFCSEGIYFLCAEIEIFSKYAFEKQRFCDFVKEGWYFSRKIMSQNITLFKIFEKLAAN
jgi:hypothetical protein